MGMPVTICRITFDYYVQIATPLPLPIKPKTRARGVEAEESSSRVLLMVRKLDLHSSNEGFDSPTRHHKIMRERGVRSPYARPIRARRQLDRHSDYESENVGVRVPPCPPILRPSRWDAGGSSKAASAGFGYRDGHQARARRWTGPAAPNGRKEGSLPSGRTICYYLWELSR